MSGGVPAKILGLKAMRKIELPPPAPPFWGGWGGRGVVTPKLRTFLFGIARPFSTFGRIGKHPEHPDSEVGECECGK